ncbi:MAG: diadenylate cyclase CdaA [Lachnospiraceae bacterium]|nr:diadenylate cyclase CdaA [Lachnospiraceae bacterium]
MLESFRDEYLSWMSMPYVNVVDVIEIIIIAFLIYHVLLWTKNTRAWNLLKGMLFIFAFALIAALFQMNTILWIFEKTINILVIAAVVVFQPELRKALETLGTRSIMRAFWGSVKFEEDEGFSRKTIEEITRACYDMGKVKTGALIVIKNKDLLEDYERTGIAVDAKVTSQLLINIFEKNTPLHDGAVIVHGNRITSATCYLPLSDNMNLSKELGTRHRAAVGISEVTDSVTIIVSEETGAVSLACGGSILRNLSQENLKSELEKLISDESEPAYKGLFRRRNKNAD